MAKAICSIDGCTSYVKCRGVCNKHYYRIVRGQQEGQLGLTRNERVLKFIEECVLAIQDKCIEPPFKYKSEYPTVNLGSGDVKIGWIVLERTKGSRPEGQEMRHLCGNRRCCNHIHLAWGTHLENMQDWVKHGCAGDRSGVNNSNYRHGGWCQ